MSYKCGFEIQTVMHFKKMNTVVLLLEVSKHDLIDSFKTYLPKLS